MALIADLYFAMYSLLTVCAAGLIRVARSLGNSNFVIGFDVAGGQQALVLTVFVGSKPMLEGTHVDMSGVVIGAAKAAGVRDVL